MLPYDFTEDFDLVGVDHPNFLTKHIDLGYPNRVVILVISMPVDLVASCG